MDKNTFTRSKSSPLRHENYLLNGLNFNYRYSSEFIKCSNLSIENIIKTKKKIKVIYDNFFSKYKKMIIIQKSIKYAEPNNQSYMIVFKKNKIRDELMNYLYKNKIETRKAITSIHLENTFKKKYKNLNLVNSEFISKNGIQLPMHSKLTLKESRKIIFFIKKLFLLKKIK